MLNIFPQTLCSGDIYPLKLTFKDKITGNPIDLTGSMIGITVKDDITEDDTQAEFKADVPGDTTGIVQFYVGPLPAGDFWTDVKMWTGTTRTTVLSPVQMHVIQSVTSR